jgi:hypothetical protein
MTRRLPVRWILVGAAAWLLVSVALGLLYAARPPSPDQALFDYIGWRITEGDLPYRDVTEINWPGAMLLHAASTALFGNTVHSFRAFDYLYLLGTISVLVFLLRSRVGWPVALVIGLLYQWLYVTSDNWFAGQRDILAAPLLFLVCFAHVRGLEGRRVSGAIGAGVGIAFAMLLKPTFAAAGLLLAAHIAVACVRRRLGLKDGILRVSLTALASFAALAVFALGAALLGILDSWWEASILFNRAVYTQEVVAWGDILYRLIHFTATCWHWLLVYSVLGVFLYRRRRTPGVVDIALLVAGTTLVSYLAQQKGFGYHLGPLVLVLAILAAAPIVGAARLALARGSRRLPVRVAGALVVLLAIAGLGSKFRLTLGGPLAWLAGLRSDTEFFGAYNGGERGVSVADTMNAAAFVESRTVESDTVQLWSRTMLVNFLAKRRFPSRFCHAYMLAAAEEPFEGAAAWTEEFREALERDPPAYIGLVRTAGGAYLALTDRDHRSAGADLLWATVTGRYREETSFGALVLFRRVASR